MGAINNTDVGDGAECDCLLCQMNRILLEEAAKNEPASPVPPNFDDLSEALDQLAHALNTDGDVAREAIETVLRANGYDETVVEEIEEGELRPFDAENFDFSYALRFLKDGFMLTRAGWNGKNQYLVAIDPERNAWIGVADDDLTPLPYIAIKTVDDCLVPWTASQTDLLAEDWMVLL